MAEALAALLFLRRRGELADFQADLIVPVPMHWNGDSTAAPTALIFWRTSLARRLRLPLAGRLLVRTRNTLPQKGLLPRQRFHNVRSAFRLRRGGAGAAAGLACSCW